MVGDLVVDLDHPGEGDGFLADWDVLRFAMDDWIVVKDDRIVVMDDLFVGIDDLVVAMDDRIVAKDD
jgi:hypothetical protein